MAPHMYLTIFSAFLILFTPLSAQAQDYGDAPDGGSTGYPSIFPQTASFPTLGSSGGANVIDLTQATLGPTASTEADANDPADSDGQPNLNPSNTDTDDGIVDFVIVLTSIPPPAGMSVNINGPAGSAGGRYFVNVLIDLNMNGQWEGLIAPGVSEWVVLNFPVMVTPGQSDTVTLPPFPFANGNRLPDGAWMRIALTQEFITDPDWNGGGQFAAGEIEDHVIELPPGKGCVAAMDCGAQRKILPAGGLAFNCTISNVGSDPCTMRHMMSQITRGANVTATPPLVAPCSANGPTQITCDPTAILPSPPPPGNSVTQSYRATRGPGNLPSRWTYRAQAIDPPAIIVPGGVIAGFTDATGDIDFIAEEKEYKEPPPQKKMEKPLKNKIEKKE